MSDSGDAGQDFSRDEAEGALFSYACPNCGQTVEAAPQAAGRLVECGACGTHFVIPSVDGSTDLPDELGPSDEEKDARAAGELDSLRMRHIIVTRRTAIRSRTYCIVAVVVCLMAAIKLILMARGEVRVLGWHWQQVLYVGFAVAALCGVPYFVKRAAYWQRESRAPLFGVGKCLNCGYDLRATSDVCPECGTAVPKDHAPPDFSTLSDGSQHARNLEKM